MEGARDHSLTIGVTGATGRVGGRVARRLAAAGYAQRLIVRDPTRAPGLAGATVAIASYDDSVALRTALGGVDVALFVSATESPDRLESHRRVVDAAAQAGVRHLVYTSFAGAAPDATFTFARDHFHTEEMIRASGMSFTFLRDNLYLDLVAHFAGDDGVIRGPAGDGKLAAVAIDDVADVATAVLLDADAHAGRVHDLTGPEALGLADIARIVGERIGQVMRYHPETIPEAYASRAIYEAPDWQVDAWVSTYTAIANGELAAVSDDVETIIGRKARSLGDVLAGEGA